jgi:hypothetical protein
MANPETEPDFYLVSTEGYGLDVPRRCVAVGRVQTRNRDDLLWVRVEPPIVYDNEELKEVVVAARHRGVSVLDIKVWPVAVHVARFDSTGDVKLLVRAEVPSMSTLRNVAWAELYRTEEEAAAATATDSL